MSNTQTFSAGNLPAAVDSDTMALRPPLDHNELAHAQAKIETGDNEDGF